MRDITKQNITWHDTIENKQFQINTLLDIDKLDESALRARIALLSDEFISRTKWENLRLSQSAKQVEVEVANKYLQLMLQQRSGTENFFGNFLSIIHYYFTHMNKICLIFTILITPFFYWLIWLFCLSYYTILNLFWLVYFF